MTNMPSGGNRAPGVKQISATAGLKSFLTPEEIGKMELEEKKRYFQAWLSMPEELRMPKTKMELANILQVKRKTVYNWMQNKEFLDNSRAMMLENNRKYTHQVIKNLFDQTQHDTAACRLWFQAIEGWNDKEVKKEVNDFNGMSKASLMQHLKMNLGRLTSVADSAKQNFFDIIETFGESQGLEKTLTTPEDDELEEETDTTSNED